MYALRGYRQVCDGSLSVLRTAIEDITDYLMVFYPEYWGLEADEYQYSVECAECNALYYGTASSDREKAIENAVNGWNHRA